MVLPTYQKNKQSHLYIEYNRGLQKVLQRIRAKYPELVMQLCAGGGARVNYGLLPYFDEFWTSDDTDALQRIYMQWGVSGFFSGYCYGISRKCGQESSDRTSYSIEIPF